MDLLRTLKKRKPKKHVAATVNVVPPTGGRPKSRGIRIRKRGTTLNLVSCFSLFLGLALVTQGQAGDYYFYEGPNGELVISNKKPPQGSKIIKQLPSVTDREVPQAQAQEPRKTPPNGQTEGSLKPPNTK